MHATKFKQLTIAAALITLFSACTTDGSLGLNSKVDYRSGSDNLSKNPLEVPPDLTSVNANSSYNTPNSAVSAQSTQVQRKSGNVLPQASNARIVVQDGIRFIEAQMPAEKAWEDVKDFWLANGFILTTENPAIGVMETDWLQNRADLPTDLVTKLFRKVADQFVSTDSVDKYRARIERSEKPDTVNIYITHRGMVEIAKEGSASNTNQWQGTTWTPSEPKPELEAEIMALMLQSFGTNAQAAQEAVQPAKNLPTRAALSASKQEIELMDSYDRAWRRVGLAFDRIGYNVQDRNRSTGIYTVQRAATDIDKESESSYFDSLAFWKDDKQTQAKSAKQAFEIKLTQQDKKTVLSITSKEGAVDPAVQKKMLNDLLAQLK
ncbi:outer membrane protein assembly factor BamC [Chitinibacter sp. S2-10]|uniref:outer membrane protein assembly factor BamC n=1 Tax=Chitinibacter sp. S2-10 TaxID=3373597 RepID=UPI0039779723